MKSDTSPISLVKNFRFLIFTDVAHVGKQALQLHCKVVKEFLEGDLAYVSHNFLI